MDVDDFLVVASQQGLRLPETSAGGPARAPEAMDALFHLPLLALAMMVIVRRNPFETATLGRRVAVLLAEHFSPLRRSPARARDIRNPAEAVCTCAGLLGGV